MNRVTGIGTQGPRDPGTGQEIDFHFLSMAHLFGKNPMRMLAILNPTISNSMFCKCSFSGPHFGHFDSAFLDELRRGNGKHEHNLIMVFETLRH